MIYSAEVCKPFAWKLVFAISKFIEFAVGKTLPEKKVSFGRILSELINQAQQNSLLG